MTVVVYSRPHCSLCEKATAILEYLRPEFGYRIAHVDITEDPILFQTYRDQIPVVVAGGWEIARGVMTTPAIRAASAHVLKR